MPPAESCEICGRPKYTQADLDRWHREFPGAAPTEDPPWAKAICWTKPEYRCISRPGIPPAIEGTP